MKQRFSSLDVKVVAHELAASLVSLRLSNIYDLSSKILLLKFAKPEIKKQLLVDSGFRCHLTDFARTAAPSPSVFVQKLRKVLKTRRVTAVTQIGTDRIIEFQFSDGQYRLYLEFFAGGNVILTDSDLKILTLLRHVPEGEGQEPQRPGLAYSLENRQNYTGIPKLTKERIRLALQSLVDRTSAAAPGRKNKKKPGDELRKGLASTISELPPILIDHAFRITKFDSLLQPVTVLEDESLLDHLVRSLEEAEKIVAAATSSATCKGYVLAKRRETGSEGPGGGLLYEDFHSFLPQQWQDDPDHSVLTFDNYNKTVDEFFSSIEGQRLESKLSEREAAAKRKLEAAKKDQDLRIQGLQVTQQLNIRKAYAIETNAERVQEAMDAVNGLIAQGMDWVDIGKLIEREQKRNNAVAQIIQLPLKLSENTITLLLGEDQQDDDNEADETDSESDSDADMREGSKQIATDEILSIDVNLGISPWSNAREYYEEKKSAAVKEQKTVQQSAFALRSAEQRIAAQLKKDLKTEKPLLLPIRRLMWFEKFVWFISSDGYLVLGGKDASQNEILYRRYLKKGDIYVHADLHGAQSVIIKNNPSTPDAPIPPSTLQQAGSLTVCGSSAWDSKAGMSAWWVTADQVSKATPTGDFLPAGSFMIRGQKNFLPPATLLLGFGLMFKISDESKAKHVKHRLQSTDEAPAAPGNEPGPGIDDKDDAKSTQDIDSDAEDNDILDQEDGADERQNPLQSSAKGDERQEDEHEQEQGPVQGHEQGQEQGHKPGQDAERTEDFEQDEHRDTSEDSNRRPKADQNLPTKGSGVDGPKDGTGDDDSVEDTGDPDGEPATPASIATGQSGKPAPQPQPPKKKQEKRGRRGKSKKMAKYRDQDEEDRAAISALIGATAGQKKAEAEAKAKLEREAAQAAALERRRAQHQRQQRQTAEHEALRNMILEEGLDTGDGEDMDQLTPLDNLVAAPLPGDEILEAVPVCAPYSAIGKLKYKIKLQPGTQKKGKAVKEILEGWKNVSSKKGVMDEKSLDREKMWPREVELIKALRPEECMNVVFVGKLRVMMSSAAAGGAGGQGKKGGARGQKKK